MDIESTIKTVPYKGHTINIYRDDDSDCPRDWDNLGILYSNHNRWSPDHKGIKELIQQVGGNIYGNVIPWDKIAKSHYFVKVWMYDHSGQTVRVADNNPWGNGYMAWDSGLCGVLAVTKERAKKEYGYKRCCKALEEKVIKVLTGEVKDLDQWMQGDVWGFETVNDTTGETVDSCWGYYDIDEAIDEAKSVVDAI